MDLADELAVPGQDDVLALEEDLEVGGAYSMATIEVPPAIRSVD